MNVAGKKKNADFFLFYFEIIFFLECLYIMCTFVEQMDLIRALLLARYSQREGKPVEISGCLSWKHSLSNSPPPPPPPLPRAPQECTFVNRVDGFLHVSNPNSSFEVDPPPPVSSYLTVFPEGDLSVTYSGALYEAARAWNPFGRGGCTRPPPRATGDCSPFHGPYRVHTVTGQHSEFSLIQRTRAIGWRRMTGDHLMGDAWAHKCAFHSKSLRGRRQKKKKKKMLAGTTRHLPPEP